MKDFTETQEFWKSEEGIKAYYWFDAFYKFRMARRAIESGYIWGWEELHEFFLYRKKFHEDMKKFKTNVK